MGKRADHLQSSSSRYMWQCCFSSCGIGADSTYLLCHAPGVVGRLAVGVMFLFVGVSSAVWKESCVSSGELGDRFAMFLPNAAMNSFVSKATSGCWQKYQSYLRHLQPDGAVLMTRECRVAEMRLKLVGSIAPRRCAAPICTNFTAKELQPNLAHKTFV